MIWAGFILGFLGSVHCLAMCGPIALSLPIPVGQNRIIGIFLYNVGRVITYGFIGLFFGFFGSVFVFAGLQQSLSITSGLVLLIMACLSFFGNKSFGIKNPFSTLIQSLKNSLGSYLRTRSLTSLFLIGLLNGLLPCGLVYIALIGAIATGDVYLGGYHMALFGLGTVPMMFAIPYSKELIKVSWRKKITKFIPLVVASLGLLLLMRGLNLGIPYLSPILSSSAVQESSCCHKPTQNK